jgi:phosphotransacetylase
MPLASFDELFADADAARPGVPTVAAGGADLTVLAALREARDRGWLRPAVTGAREDIERLAREGGVALDGIEIVEGDPAGAAVGEVRRGARLLMKGQIATPALMKAVLDPAAGLRTGRVICQVVLMEVMPAGRRFLLADTGVSTHPDLAQKIDILRSSVAAAHALGEPCPRVAVMSATEKPTAALPDTLEAAELQRRADAGELPGCAVQGPLSFDLAYAPESGQRKGVAGAVAGAADVMLFPDLVSANLTVKAIMYTADCRYGGVLCGAACPVVFMSRADSAATRLRSLALALRLARHQPG